MLILEGGVFPEKFEGEHSIPYGCIYASDELKK
jgi:hypothetical protein